MIFEKTFIFNHHSYKKGRKINTDKLFTDFVNKCEREFFKSTNIFSANFFFANNKTMKMIKDCYFDSQDIVGTLVITGNLANDEYINNLMANFFKKERIVAISTEADDDEPLWLIIDNNIEDGKYILKYISDDEIDDDGDEQVQPINGKLLEQSLIMN